MKTKDQIKEKARDLFNRQSTGEVNLRMIAKALKKAYGNITYYFPNKEALIQALFDDMNQELSSLQDLYKREKDLLSYFLNLPAYSFDITMKYLFFSRDLVEIKRKFPDFFKYVHDLNQERKVKWFILLEQLQSDGFLKPELTDQDLEYMMQLSAGVRLLYVQEKDFDNLDQQEFSVLVNRLLKPYLSEKGLKTYVQWNLVH